MPSGVISATLISVAPAGFSTRRASSSDAGGGSHTDTVAGAVRSPVEWLKTGDDTTCSFGTTSSRPSPVSMYV